jgi:large subunit ribosomal protein L35
VNKLFHYKEENRKMPKIKTHSSSKKRFGFTGKGKIKRAKAYKSHILTKKTAKRKRNLRKGTLVSDANYSTVKSMIPYK